MMRALVVLLTLALTACASGSEYASPQGAAVTDADRTLDIQRPRGEVWDAIIPVLGQNFFVINNMDRTSGFLNISYSGDPEKYIDCGMITYSTPGQPDKTIPGARASFDYVYVYNLAHIPMTRTMTLDGRMNIVLQEAAPNATKVTVSTKYIVTRRSVGGGQIFEDSGSFNSDSKAQIGTKESTIVCRPTGQFERDILSLFEQAS